MQRASSEHLDPSSTHWQPGRRINTHRDLPKQGTQSLKLKGVRPVFVARHLITSILSMACAMVPVVPAMMDW